MSGRTNKYGKIIAILLMLCIVGPLVFNYKEIYVSAMGLNNEQDSLNRIELKSEDVNIIIHYGFEQQARYGRDIVITAEIESKKSSGTYELSFILADSQNRNEKYSKKIDLTKNQVNQVDIIIQLLKEVKKIKISLYDEKGYTVVEEVKLFHAMNYGPYKLVGILSDNPSNLSYMSAFGAKCFELDERNFPNIKEGLDMLDFIVIDEYDTSKLSEEQINALEEFVIDGGSLVLGTGSYLGNVLGNFVEHDILNIKGIKDEGELNKVPITSKDISICTEESFSELLKRISMYENNRINTLARLEERSSNSTIDPSLVYIGDSMIHDTLLSQLKMLSINKEIVDFTICNASTILVENDSVLLQKLMYGKGNILVTSFQMGMSIRNTEIANVHTSYLELANIINTNLPLGYQGKLDSESYGAYYDWQDSVDISDSRNLPRIWALLIILMVYIAMIGPVVYFILKRIGKSVYLFGVIPILTVVFILLVYANGVKTRITDPYIGFTTVERFNEKENKIEGTMALRLSFPTNKESSVSVEGIDEIYLNNSTFPAYPLYRNNILLNKEVYLDMTIFHSGLTFMENEVRIEVANKPAFSNSYYETLYEYESDPVIEGCTQINEQTISGIIKNKTNHMIKDAYVYSNGILISLGDIGSNELIHIESYPRENLLSSEMVYMSNLLEDVLEYNDKGVLSPNSNRKQQVMRKVVDELSKEQSTSYFISLTEELDKENPYYELSRGKGSYGTRVLLIPLVEKNVNDSQVMVASMDKFMSITGGENSYIAQYRYMFSKSMIVDYYFPSEDVITEIFASTYLNQGVEGKDTTLVCENVYFFNTETKDYDLVFQFNKLDQPTNLSKIQRVKKEDLKNYLTSGNHLRVKYENGAIGDDVSILPCLSYYKELAHVKD